MDHRVYSETTDTPNCAYPKITALVCALNEASNLPYVLPKIPPSVDEVLLVDGHSSDGTAELAHQLWPGIRVLQQPGKGKGEAMRFGIQQAAGDIIVTLDADGSNARRLTDENYPWNDDPTWSSDGKLIAFRSNRNDQVDIYVIKVDGSLIPQQLTHNSEIDQDRAPAWRPANPNLSGEDDE